MPLTPLLALSLWEDAAELSPLDRAVRMAAAVDGLTVVDAAGLPLDERDRRLIAARRDTFGAAAEIVASCTTCGERAEGGVDLDALLAAPLFEATVECGGRSVACRPPSSLDVARAARANDPAILVRAATGGEAADAEAVAAALGAAHPLLDIELALPCEACGATFQARFDIGAYLWAEVGRLAEALLDDVHRLAAAYGWRESDILALPARRRVAYLARLAP